MNTYQVFKKLPDTAVITDSFGYILDFNRQELFDSMKKGQHISQYIQLPLNQGSHEVQIRSKHYHLKVTSVTEETTHSGFIFYFSDVTRQRATVMQNHQKQKELSLLHQKLLHANDELTAYARQVEALSGYNEQLRLAREIHDTDGHAITVLHTISQMCRKLLRKDIKQYRSLINKGIRICREQSNSRQRTFKTITETLNHFSADGLFDVRITIQGEEPVLAAPYAELIRKICGEAYHNTLNHSLATVFFIKLIFDHEKISLELWDNGRCHGSFEKGFGLSVMEDTVLKSGGTIKFTMEENKGFLIQITLTLED